MHPGRYIFVCRYCTPTSNTSFACTWRDANNDARVHNCLRNVYSSCIHVIPSCPLNHPSRSVFLHCYYIQNASLATMLSLEFKVYIRCSQVIVCLMLCSPSNLLSAKGSFRPKMVLLLGERSNIYINPISPVEIAMGTFSSA